MTKLQRAKATIHKLDPDVSLGDHSYETYLILLSSIIVGPNIKKISKFAHIPRMKIVERARRLRANGVWVGSKVHCEWMDKKAGGVAFIADSLVADGLMNRSHKES